MNSDLIQLLRQPEQSDLPAIMWFWNDRISEEGIERQLRAFAAVGVREVFVHPLWGLELEYLSPRFFELIKHTVAVAGQLGLKYSIYDEYNWPSGAAGGLLLKQEPWTKGKKLVCLNIPLYSGQPFTQSLPGQLVSAQILYGDSLRSIEDVTATLIRQPEGGGVKVRYINRSCSSSVLSLCYSVLEDGLPTTGMWASFSWYETGTVDTLNPQAVRRFIDYTHEQYKKAVGEEFGRTVRSVFTDEVSALLMFDRALGVFPWTDGLPDAFARDHGYSLIPCLYALHSDGTSDQELKIRYDFWKTVTRLFSESFMQQTADWCRDNHLIATGHLSGEETLYWHAFQMGDFYTSSTPLDVPGIDNILSNLYADRPVFGSEAKLAASTAKFNGQSRVMCETFSGSGWDMTMAQMKRIINRLVLWGINDFIFMGAYYSLDGARKHMPLGYPPSHGYNNPLFKHYPLICTYTARLCALSAATRPAGQVLLLLPQTTQYMDAENCGGHDGDWKAATEGLSQSQIEYDIFFEALAPEAVIQDQTILLRGYAYRMLIVPGAEYLDEATARMIESFTAAGGKILYINRIPERVVDSGRKLQLFDRGCPSGDGDFRCVQSGNRFYCTFDRKNEQSQADFSDFLRRTAGGDLRPIRIISPRQGIHVAQRENGQARIYLVANDTNQPQLARLAVRSADPLQLLDPETGLLTALPRDIFQDEQAVEFTLPGYGLRVIVSSPAAADRAAADKRSFSGAGQASDNKPAANWADNSIPADSSQVSVTGSCRFTAIGGNLLPLKLQLAAGQQELFQLFDQGGIAAVVNRLAANGGQTCGMPQEFPGSAGIGFGDRYLAVAQFQADCLVEDLTLKLEYEPNMLVFLDGLLLSAFQPCPSWGVRGAAADIADRAQPGRHTLVLIGRMPDYAAPHSIPTAYLQGSFSVGENDALALPRTLLEPREWNTQGYPYFCGDGVYETDFTVGSGVQELLLQVDTADVAEVFVNGQPVGCAAWQPYIFDLSPAIREGKNLLRLVITSTYANFMDVTKINLIRQGFAEYADNPNQVRCGLLAPVRFLVKARK